MAKLSKEALEVQKEFLPMGARIAALSHDLHKIGAHQAGLAVQAAADTFHEDVERILKLRERRGNHNGKKPQAV